MGRAKQKRKNASVMKRIRRQEVLQAAMRRIVADGGHKPTLLDNFMHLLARRGFDPERVTLIDVAEAFGLNITFEVEPREEPKT